MWNWTCSHPKFCHSKTNKIQKHNQIPCSNPPQAGRKWNIEAYIHMNMPEGATPKDWHLRVGMCTRGSSSICPYLGPQITKHFRYFSSLGAGIVWPSEIGSSTIKTMCFLFFLIFLALVLEISFLNRCGDFASWNSVFEYFFACLLEENYGSLTTKESCKLDILLFKMRIFHWRGTKWIQMIWNLKRSCNRKSRQRLCHIPSHSRFGVFVRAFTPKIYSNVGKLHWVFGILIPYDSWCPRRFEAFLVGGRTVEQVDENCSSQRVRWATPVKEIAGLN